MANLFFDFDGTIANSAPGIITSLKQAIAELKLRELGESEYYTFIGPPIKDSIDEHYPELAEDAKKQLADTYHKIYVKDGKFNLEVFDGLTEALVQLRQGGHRLYVASAKPDEPLKAILDHYDLTQYFDEAFGATAEFPGKAAILRNAMDQTGSTQGDSVMIGDTMNDINGGNANGVKTIGVTYGFGDVSTATRVVTDPAGIVIAVDELF